MFPNRTPQLHERRSLPAGPRSPLLATHRAAPGHPRVSPAPGSLPGTPSVRRPGPGPGSYHATSPDAGLTRPQPRRCFSNVRRVPLSAVDPPAPRSSRAAPNGRTSSTASGRKPFAVGEAGPEPPPAHAGLARGQRLLPADARSAVPTRSAHSRRRSQLLEEGSVSDAGPPSPVTPPDARHGQPRRQVAVTLPVV